MAPADGPILVAGATGRAGVHVVSGLLAAGAEVRAISRSRDRLRQLKLPAGAGFVADVLQPALLAAPMSGVRTVISLVGLDPIKFGGRTMFLKGDLQANRNLLAAARSAGVQRFVYLSVFSEGRLSKTAYIRAHEEFERELRQSGLEAAVVRPSGFFAALWSFRDLARKRGFVPVIGKGTARTNPVHEADVAEACVAAATADRPEERTDIGGPEIFTRREIAELAFTGLTRKPRVISSPTALWSAFRCMARPVAPHTAEVLEFGITVSSMDAVAPQVGKRRLADYFAADYFAGMR